MNDWATVMIGAVIVAVAVDVMPKLGGWLLLVVVLGMLTVRLRKTGGGGSTW